MGLAFAAMALALSRLGIIDHILSPHWNHQGDEHSPVSQRKSATPSQEQVPNHHVPDSQPVRSNGLIASRMCQVISVWCFGYGIGRYVSVRRNLLQGRFVPAIWGPVFMTCGTLGTLATIIEMDWSRSRKPVL